MEALSHLAWKQKPGLQRPSTTNKRRGELGRDKARGGTERLAVPIQVQFLFVMPTLND